MENVGMDVDQDLRGPEPPLVFTRRTAGGGTGLRRACMHSVLALVPRRVPLLHRNDNTDFRSLASN